MQASRSIGASEGRFQVSRRIRESSCSLVLLRLWSSSARMKINTLKSAEIPDKEIGGEHSLAKKRFQYESVSINASSSALKLGFGFLPTILSNASARQTSVNPVVVINRGVSASVRLLTTYIPALCGNKCQSINVLYDRDRRFFNSCPLRSGTEWSGLKNVMTAVRSSPCSTTRCPFATDSVPAYSSNSSLGRHPLSRANSRSTRFRSPAGSICSVSATTSEKVEAISSSREFYTN